MATDFLSQIPFRRKLILFAILTALIPGIPLLFFVLGMPWELLRDKITTSKSILRTVQQSISSTDRARMEAFSVEQFKQTQDVTPQVREALSYTFTMFVLYQRLLTQDEIEEQLDRPVDYQLLKRGYTYWENTFQNNPGLLPVFQRNKRFLQRTKSTINNEGLGIADIYFVLDLPSQRNSNRVLFVLDGYTWQESSFPGDIYEVPKGSAFLENTRSGSKGVGNNKIYDPSHFFLPQFYTDSYGQWFSVWNTLPSQIGITTVLIDFTAEDIAQTMSRSAFLVALGLATLFGLIYITTTLLSKRYSKSPVELSNGIQQVAKGNYSYEIPELFDEFDTIRIKFNKMTEQLRERVRLQEVLEKILSKELAEQAAREGIVLGGEEADCTILFTDFAGFSTLTRDMSPREVVTTLNDYFGALIPIIKRYGGFTDKYIGDAIVAIFGAPIVNKDHAQQGVLAAIEMQQAIRAMNEKRKFARLPVFEMRVGLNSGRVLVGAIGSDQKLEYTSIGESTNLANRMESVCSIGNILMSTSTYDKLPMEFKKKAIYPLVKREVEVKGYSKSLTTYELRTSPFDIQKNLKANTPEEFYRYLPY